MAGLQSPRFTGVEVLERCLEGTHRMRRPETGVAVQLVQQALIDLGFQIPSGATGNFLDETSAAVVAFKRSHGLVPDDPVLGPGTMSALDRDIVAYDRDMGPTPDRVLGLGDRGEDVALLHSVLNYHCVLPTELLELGDTFTETTDLRLRSFQVQNALTPSGVVDADTNAALMTFGSFSCSYQVNYPPPEIAGPGDIDTDSPTEHEFQLTSGVKHTIQPWKTPPTKLEYVLDLEASWVIKNPGSGFPFRFTAGTKFGQLSLPTLSTDSHANFAGGAVMTGAVSTDFRLGPIQISPTLKAGFEAEHLASNPKVKAVAEASVVTGLQFSVLENRFYLFLQNEIGMVLDTIRGEMTLSPQMVGTAGVTLRF